MKKFVTLIAIIDESTKTNVKIQALVDYFKSADKKDIVWTIALFTHKRPKRTISTKYLKEWASETSSIPQWLFDESYHVVGDLAETISLILPQPESSSDKSLSHWIEYLMALRDKEECEKKAKIVDAWKKLNSTERFVFNKLITGGFRIGISQNILTRALNKFTNIPENEIALKLTGKWEPETTTLDNLLFSKDAKADASKPYPFYLSYALDTEIEKLGKSEEWQAERKWDGIRGQLIKRKGEVFVWSRGEELMTEKFPEYEKLKDLLDDGIALDGEILPYDGVNPLPFNILQTRIGRKNITKKILETTPVIFLAYDIMEHNHEDIRNTPLTARRNKLERVVEKAKSEVLKISPIVNFVNWVDLKDEKNKSREHYCEGLMLKHKNSVYREGRKRGDWWKWKVDPLTIDAVMIYAMRGNGRRANLYTDYTFAVWEHDKLIPFAKAYSGLTDAEIKEVDKFVKQNTLDRFGPVRSVTPELVFEIAFEGINASTRHKSGVALRFPRINRWRKDKKAREANTLDELKRYLEIYS